MKILKRTLAALCLMTVVALFTAESQAASCNPQENCTRRGPNLPSPTLRNPNRTVKTYFDDPICIARRTACQGELKVCLIASLVTHQAGAACIACVTAGVIASGYTGGAAAQAAAAVCLGVCGISATALEKAINTCI